MADEVDDTQPSQDEGPAPAVEPTPPRRNHDAVWAGIALAVGAVLIVSGLVWRAETSPRASIGRVAKAAVDGDIEAVEAAIDTTAIISAAVDDMYNDPHFRASYVASYTARHPTVTPEDIKARLEKAVNQELREHLADGSLPRRIPIPADSIKALVAQAWARQSVKSITIKGKYAYAVVVVPYHGKNYDVVVRLRRSGNTWVVDRIENLPEVLKAAGF
jgi:hypothetical protein